MYRSTVTQHLLRVSVTDRAGRPVGDLGKEDFSLREDGDPQPIQSLLAPFDSPLEIALISDRSGSMDIGYDKAKEAAHTLLDGLRASDCVRFSAFMDVPLTTGWMRPDDPILRRAIDTGWFGGPTALYDALMESQVALARRSRTFGVGRLASDIPMASALLDLFQFERFYRELLDPSNPGTGADCIAGTGASPPRQAILVVTDGVDSASSGSSQADVLRAAAFSAVPIFAASVRPPRPNGAADVMRARSRTGVPTTDYLNGYLIKGMGAIAETSGGALASLSTMVEAHQWLLDRLRSTYVLGFKSRALDADGSLDAGRAAVPGSLELAIVGRDDFRISFNEGIHDEALARTAAATESTLRGFDFLRKAESNQAAVEFRHALSLDADLAAAQFGLGSALTEKDELAPALQHLERARDLAPWAGVVHATMTRVQIRLGLEEAARASAVRTMEADADRASEISSLFSPPLTMVNDGSARPRLLLLVPSGADGTTYDTSRRLLAALGRAVLQSDSLGLAGSADTATLALRVRFVAAGRRQRRPTVDAVLYLRSGGNYDPIELTIGEGDDVTLNRTAGEIVARVVELAASPPSE